MKKIVLIAVLVLVCLGILAQPFWSVLQIQQGLQEQDQQKLEAYIDFASVRTSLKQQIDGIITEETKARLGDNPLAKLGISLALKMTQTIVDGYVTPQGMATLFSGKADTTRLMNKPQPVEAKPSTAVQAPVASEQKPLALEEKASETEQAAKASKPDKPIEINLMDYKLESLSKLVFYLPVEKGEPIQIRMERDVLRWRMTAVILPLAQAQGVAPK